jgi:hypothetical protein
MVMLGRGVFCIVIDDDSGKCWCSSIDFVKISVKNIITILIIK